MQCNQAGVLTSFMSLCWLQNQGSLLAPPPPPGGDAAAGGGAAVTADYLPIIIAAAAVGAILGLCCCCLIAAIAWKRRRRKQEEEEEVQVRSRLRVASIYGSPEVSCMPSQRYARGLFYCCACIRRAFLPLPGVADSSIGVHACL